MPAQAGIHDVATGWTNFRADAAEDEAAVFSPRPPPPAVENDGSFFIISRIGAKFFCDEKIPALAVVHFSDAHPP